VNIPSALQQAALASQTPEVVLLFVTTTHADLDAPVYLVNNTQDMVRGGQTYTAIAQDITLPSDTDSGDAAARLVLDALHSSTFAPIEMIRSISSETPAEVGIVLALASDPDTTEYDLGTFEFKSTEWDSLELSGDLTYEDNLDVLIPGDCMTPDNTPGAF
jgi:hypothetical protein